MSSASRIKTISVNELVKVNKGIYILEMSITSQTQIGIKKFRNIRLEKGYYYYAGSAQKNLYHRVSRHFRKDKIVHWHIDHLTTQPGIKLESSLIIPYAEKEIEWELAYNLENYFDCSIPLPGFGNSDTNKTKSHLFYKRSKIPYSHFISRYQSIVRFIP